MPPSAEEDLLQAAQRLVERLHVLARLAENRDRDADARGNQHDGQHVALKERGEQVVRQREHIPLCEIHAHLENGIRPPDEARRIDETFPVASPLRRPAIAAVGTGCRPYQQNARVCNCIAA